MEQFKSEIAPHAQRENTPMVTNIIATILLLVTMTSLAVMTRLAFANEQRETPPLPTVSEAAAPSNELVILMLPNRKHTSAYGPYEPIAIPTENEEAALFQCLMQHAQAGALPRQLHCRTLRQHEAEQLLHEQAHSAVYC